MANATNVWKLLSNFRGEVLKRLDKIIEQQAEILAAVTSQPAAIPKRGRASKPNVDNAD